MLSDSYPHPRLSLCTVLQYASGSSQQVLENLNSILLVQRLTFVFGDLPFSSKWGVGPSLPAPLAKVDKKDSALAPSDSE